MKTQHHALHCKDDRARRQMARQAQLNGLDYLEVSQDQTVLTVYFFGKAPKWTIKPQHLCIDGGQRVRGICVTHVDINRSGREDLDDCMRVTVDRPGDFSQYRLCIVQLDEEGRPTTHAPEDFDPRYACLCFSFKVGCSSDLDCTSTDSCDEETLDEPAIDYLAKDYASFRRLILDRLSLLMPDWLERHVPDLGITLVEVLAYVADQLSYYQDAVATEAYLDTARQRISVRRHVRLVDYQLHEGCNARTWLTVVVLQDELTVRAQDVYFVTATDQTSTRALREESLLQEGASSCLVFEPLQYTGDMDLVFYQAHNEIHFYTWGAAECCVPKGATSATLVDPGQWPDTSQEQAPDQCIPVDARTGKLDASGQSSTPALTLFNLRLKPCDVLIFEEVKGPHTGNPADADPTRRHAVRLTRVIQTHDPLTRTLLVDVEWCDGDALPFPLCISSVSLPPKCEPLCGVSVARGNVVLVDHGMSLEGFLGQVPIRTITARCEDECTPAEVQRIPGRFHKNLPQPGVTFATPVPESRSLEGNCVEGCGPLAASRLLRQDPRVAMPQVSLRSIVPAPDGEPACAPSDAEDPTALATSIVEAGPDASQPAAWLRSQLEPELLNALSEWAAQKPLPPLPESLRDQLQGFLRNLMQDWAPRQDLLASDADDRHFVVEVDDEGRAHLRFGDGDCGHLLDAGDSIHARYRVGNGPVGNVGAEAVKRIVFRNNFPSGVDLAVRNPLPAIGGTAAEPVAEAKLRAPYAFRMQLERAITPADYAAIVMRDFPFKVQRAAAEFHWDGAHTSVTVAVDAAGQAEPDEELLHHIERHLQRYRRIGHDLEVAAARQVPLDLALTVCVKSGYLRGHVETAVLDALSDRVLHGGRRGLFHPDELSFGEGIYLSRIVATVQALEGVESVVVTKLERLHDGPGGALDSGVLTLAGMEVARLDNNPDFPEHGRLKLRMEGGR